MIWHTSVLCESYPPHRLSPSVILIPCQWTSITECQGLLYGLTNQRTAVVMSPIEPLTWHDVCTHILNKVCKRMYKTSKWYCFLLLKIHLHKTKISRLYLSKKIPCSLTYLMCKVATETKVYHSCGPKKDKIKILHEKKIFLNIVLLAECIPCSPYLVTTNTWVIYFSNFFQLLLCPTISTR